jgi:hypothetical protein
VYLFQDIFIIQVIVFHCRAILINLPLILTDKY